MCEDFYKRSTCEKLVLNRRSKLNSQNFLYIQFRQRLSKKSVKAYATTPKGSLGNAQ